MSDHHYSSPAKKKLRPPFPKDGDDGKKSPMKRFMSPTISRAAKVNPLPRTKTPSADRIESPPVKFASPRASNDGFKDENVITDDSSQVPCNYLPLSRSDGEENLSSVKKSPMKHFLSPTVNQLSRTKILGERNDESLPVKFIPPPPPTPPQALSFKLNTDGFRDENEKDNVMSDDSLLIPYNPASNYLSPRPKFLRYRPERRSLILQRRVELEEDVLDLEQDTDTEAEISPLSPAKEDNVLDLEQDTDSTEADISSGNAAAAAPLSPAKNKEVDDGIEEESEEDEFEEEEGRSVLGRVFRFLLLLMVVAASTVYITSMNNHHYPIEAEYQEIQSYYPVGFLSNGTLLAGEGRTLLLQQPVAAPSFLVEETEEEAMEVSEGRMLVVEEAEEDVINEAEEEVSYTDILHPAAVEVLEEEKLIDMEEVAELDEIHEAEEEEASYTDILQLHPAAVEVLEEERRMEVEQKAEEAMEVVSEGGTVLEVEHHQPSESVEIQEEEENFTNVEEVTENPIDVTGLVPLGAIYAAILAAAAGLLLLLLTTTTMRRKRGNAAASSESAATVVPPRALSKKVTVEEKSEEEEDVVHEQTCSSFTMASGEKRTTSSIKHNEPSRSDYPAESSYSATRSGEKGTSSSSSSVIKRKKKTESADSATTTPLRRSTRLASRGILSP
ncbi:hypothetical protein LINGRAHAP2_LOCUS12307 [Linum grandiflorum]